MKTYAIIGDSHECVQELKLLIEKIEKNIPDAQIVHIGDCVDKGNNTKGMIHYMWDRVVKGNDVFIPGNHEMFVYRRIRGELGALEDTAREKALFGSQEVFLSTPILRDKFEAILAKGIPFLVITDPNNDHIEPVYVTHAPCKLEFLGQYDDRSIREQRNYRTIDRTIPAVDDLAWFYDEADFERPLHIVGHMAHSGKTAEECIYRNKVFLDTGCVYGNGLSAAIVSCGDVQDWYFQPAIWNRTPEYPLSNPLGLRKAGTQLRKT